MGRKKDDAVTDEETTPDAAEGTPSADAEVGTSDVNFTTADGTGEGPASSSDGTDLSSTDSTTSPSPSEGGADPLASGATGELPGAPDASSKDTASDDVNSTEEGDEKTMGVVPTHANGGIDKAGDKSAKESLKGDHADGEGATHIGTDTPEKLISNPYNDDTGEPLFKKDTRSKEPLNFDSFKETKEDDAPKGKVSKAIELMTQVGDKL